MSFSGLAVQAVSKTKRSRACAVVVGMAVMVGLAAAQSDPIEAVPRSLERVEITGSAIRGASQQGSVPVEVITRKDIERSGATTLNELLRSIPSIDFNDFGELLSNSPSASGTARISMRGLSANDLLVLVNGRRLPVNAIYDASGEGGTVDINMISLAAIERIEILKDGGSAIYGADAVAGVFNIITRRNYQGVSTRASYGQTSRNDGQESSVGLTMGFGDLTTQRVNVMVGLDYFNRSPIYRSERESSHSGNFERFGGPDLRSVLAPTGNIIDPNTGALVGMPYRPCPADSQMFGGAACGYDFNSSVLTAYSGANRLSSMALATVQITPQTQGFFEATYAHSENQFNGHPVPGFFLVPALDAGQGAFRDPTIPITGANPFGSIYILGRFMQGGERMTMRESSLTNLTTGLEGTVRGLDWKASIGRGVSRLTNSDQNYFNAALWAAATGAGLIDPTVNTNSPALIESLKVSPTRVARSTLDTVQTQISGPLLDLPAGSVQFAVGASYYSERLVDTPDILLQTNNVQGAVQQSGVDAKRHNDALFMEFKVPLAPTVETQLAVRHDRYPSISQTSPKAAIGWHALSNWLLRASYTRSFRAPVLKQLYGAREQSAALVTDAESCQILTGNPVCTLTVFQLSGANPELKPEKATTWNLGSVFDYEALALSVDYWHVKKDQAISVPTLDSAIRHGLYTRVGPQVLVNTNLFNLVEFVTGGVDVDLQLRFPTAWGRLTLRNLSTHYTEVGGREPGENWQDLKGTYGRPNWRNRFGITLEKQPWTGQFVVRSTGGFSDSDDALPHPVGTRRVAAYEEFDVQVSHKGEGELRGLTLTGGIKNLTDRQPPFSLQNASDARYSQMGFAEIYGNRGRFYYLSAGYEF